MLKRCYRLLYIPATVAMANKTARIIWAIMARGETYRTGHQPTVAA
jgi:transposase